MVERAQLPLALSMGEPAGIGPDLILQLYAQRQALNLPVFIVYGAVPFLRARAKRLGLQIDIAACTPDKAGEIFATQLPVVDIAGAVEDLPGQLDETAAPVVIEAIARAVSDIGSLKCSALVTAPIHKAALYGAGFTHPGHTEYLAALCQTAGVTPMPVMMLAHEDLRTVPMTIHVPLKDVAPMISRERILDTARIVATDLQTRFGISKPKLAIAGLNPHAGEDGTIGIEERDIIGPAIAELQAEGVDAVGPLSADTLFYPPHWRKYDVVIAMYHDQALIPIKTVAFDAGVNVTLGLPIVRTSPDHGTALDLAGTGSASTSSMLAAIRLAQQMASRPAA